MKFFLKTFPSFRRVCCLQKAGAVVMVVIVGCVCGKFANDEASFPGSHQFPHFKCNACTLLAPKVLLEDLWRVIPSRKIPGFRDFAKSHPGNPRIENSWSRWGLIPSEPPTSPNCYIVMEFSICPFLWLSERLKLLREPVCCARHNSSTLLLISAHPSGRATLL